MSTLSASPASSPPEYSVIISKGDLPPPYPGDEEPPPYSSVVLEAANTVACDEDENRSRYCNGSRCSWSCPQCPSRIRPVWRKPVAPCLVSYFDIFVSILGLVYYTFVLRDLKKGKVPDLEGFYFLWLCLASFHIWWLFGACKLLKSTDPTLPRNERRQLVKTWKTVNWCLVVVFWFPVIVGGLMLVLAVVNGDGSNAIPWISIFVITCIPLAVRVKFYCVVYNFTEF